MSNGSDPLSFVTPHFSWHSPESMPVSKIRLSLRLSVQRYEFGRWEYGPIVGDLENVPFVRERPTCTYSRLACH